MSRDDADLTALVEQWRQEAKCIRRNAEGTVVETPLLFTVDALKKCADELETLLTRRGPSAPEGPTASAVSASVVSRADGLHPSVPNGEDSGTSAPAAHWRDIESAPKDGTRLLMFGSLGVHIAEWSAHATGDFNWNDTEYTFNPTHWMPLPPVPTAANPGDKPPLKQGLNPGYKEPADASDPLVPQEGCIVCGEKVCVGISFGTSVGPFCMAHWKVIRARVEMAQSLEDQPEAATPAPAPAGGLSERDQD